MTKSQIIKKIIKQVWYFVLAYITDFLFPKILEAFNHAKNQFIEYLWRELKEDFKFHITSTLKAIDTYFSDTSYGYKEQLIIDSLFAKIKLPILFKIIKPLIKNLLRKKLREFITNAINKATNKIDKLDKVI